MDGHRFDAIAKALATGRSRRDVLTGLAGVGAGALAALAGRVPGGAAPPSKVTICHWDAGLGAYQQLSVPAKERGGHIKHAQDLLAPDFASPATCGDCTTACPAPANGAATCADGDCGISCDPGYEPDASGTACVAACVPDCSADICGGSDGCGGVCLTGSCPDGTTCHNGGCFSACLNTGNCPFTTCPNCGCRGTLDLGNQCLDTATFIGQCASTADCPAGSICSSFASGNPAKPNLCTQPCCA